MTPIVAMIAFICNLAGAEAAYEQVTSAGGPKGPLSAGCISLDKPLRVTAQKILRGPERDWQGDQVILVQLQGQAYTLLWRVDTKS